MHWEAGCSRGISPSARCLLGSSSVQLTSLRRMVCSVMLLGLEMAWGCPALGGFDAADYGGLLWQLLFKPLVQRGLVVGRRQGGGEDSPKGP